MKRNIALLAFVAFSSLIIYAYHGGPALLHGIDGTGVSSSGCGNCHGSATSMTVTVELDSAGTQVTSYHPGLSYTVKISGTNTSTSTLPAFGFQLAVVNSTASADAGTFGSVPANTHKATTAQSGLNHSTIEQSTQLTATTGTGGSGTTYVESIPWTAPAAGTGSVKLYGVINAVNNNGSDGSTDKYKVATPVTITEAVASPVVASVSISLTSGSMPACAGISLTFTATPTNGGTAPTYQWKVNGNNAGTGVTFTTSSLTNGQVVTCVMTSNLSGVTSNPATSNAVTANIISTVTPTISINSGNANVCAGQTISFSSAITNGGTPAYQWKINGNNAGTSSTFSSVLNNNDAVTCVMTSNAACASQTTATSNSISVTVNPIVTPTISINTPSTNICSGQGASFTSSATNGGSSPVYQWKVNGNNAGTGSTFSQVLNNNDVVTCVLTSNTSCASSSTATSNAITITTGTTVIPAISISADDNSVCAGTTVNLSATPANGGTLPTYQWKVNGINAGTGSAFSSVFNNGDTVNCIMASNSSCVSVSTATSNTVAITVNAPPVVTVSPNGNVSVCANDSILLTATGGTSFTWSNNTTGNTVWVSQQGNYTVTAIDNNSCSVASSTVNVSVIPLPNPTISQLGDTLTATSANTYQWFFNGSTIAITQKIIAHQSGNYSVLVTDANGCSNTSTELLVVISAVNELNESFSAKLYPIPNNGSFIIESAEHEPELSVTDMYGKLVFYKNGLSPKENISIKNLVPQIYFAILRSGNKIRVLKMEVK